MSVIKDKITNNVQGTDGHKLLHFSIGEQDANKKRESAIPLKKLRFTRKGAVGAVRGETTSSLHHGQAVDRQSAPDNEKKERQHRYSRKIYESKGAGKDTGQDRGQDRGQDSTQHTEQDSRQSTGSSEGQAHAIEGTGQDRLNFEVSNTSTGHSKLMFTAAEQTVDGSPPKANASEHGRRNGARSTRLMFTEAEKAADIFPSSEGTSVTISHKPKNEKLAKGKSVGKRIAYGIGNDLSDEISKQADASENDAVRGADRERKVVSKGLHYGGRVGKWHRSGRDARLDKRQAKKAAKEIKLGQKSKRHFELYGDELPSKFRRDGKQQKRQMKRKQIRTFMDAKLGKDKVDVTLKVLKFIVNGTKKIVSTVVSWIAFPLLGVVVVVALLLGMAALMFSLMQTTATTILSAYTSADADIEAASMLATKLEAELEQRINGIPSQWEWGHIDEFRYDLEPIGHDPFELMAYLSVSYPGFDMGLLSPVPGEIERLHDIRYDLILEQQVETRYRTETYTDPVTEEETEEEVPYDYYILNIILRSKGIEATVAPQLKATPEGELWEWYGVLMETCGARQEIVNPFDGDWRSNITSLYGQRINPRGTNLQTHRGLDIAMPEGTSIAAGVTGQVQHVGYDATYGNYIVIADDTGRQVKYAHCHTIQAAKGDSITAGDSIATVGNTGASTGSHLHIEIRRDGQYLNPIYALEFGGNEE